MPRADLYMSTLLAPRASKTVVRRRKLTQFEAASLSRGLQADAADFYYSAWVSFLDALNGLNKGFYTWATIKLYYTVFYAFRSSLAQDGICAFHADQSPYTVDALPGATPVSCNDRGTHKTVLKTFQRRNTAHPLVSQFIGLDEAVDWLMHRREHANYNQQRFSEPACGNEFNYVAANGLRKALNAYVADSAFLYVFDPEHAMLAYPLRALQLIGATVAPMTAASLSEENKNFLKSRVKDSSGSAIPTILAELRRLALIS